jgi:hypothetical protein
MPVCDRIGQDGHPIHLQNYLHLISFHRATQHRRNRKKLKSQSVWEAVRCSECYALPSHHITCDVTLK